MKLKQLLLIPIAALSLGGSLYGMESSFAKASADKTETNKHQVDSAIDDNTLEAFFLAIAIRNINKIRTIARQHPTIVNACAPATVKILIGQRLNETALDYAIRTIDPDLVEILLELKSNVNAPGKDYLVTILRDIQLGVIKDHYRDNAIQIIHLLCSAGINMDDIDYHTIDDNTAKILHNHINNRLAQAIVNNNVDEVRRIITKYNLNINQELPFYEGRNWDSPCLSSFIPLHLAVVYEKNDVARLLINDLNADVTITEASSGQNALHHGLNYEIAQLLITKGCNPNVADKDGKKPIDKIARNLTPERLHELRAQPEQIANFHALKRLYKNQHNIPANNPPVINNNGNNPTGPTNGANNGGPQPDPVDPGVITNNPFSWKLIGGVVVVGAAVVAAKKLYDWYYKKAEVTQDDKTDADAEQNESEKEADKDKTANQTT